MYEWGSAEMSTPKTSTPKMSTPKMSIPEMSTVPKCLLPKCLLCQNVYSQNIYFYSNQWWGPSPIIPGEWLSFRRFTSNYPDPDPVSLKLFWKVTLTLYSLAKKYPQIHEPLYPYTPKIPFKIFKKYPVSL